MGSNVIVGGGLYKASTGKMQATLMALDSATGSTVWTTSLDHSGFGAIRGVILDAGSLVATGYVDNNEGGFLFIADGDNAKAMAWKFDLSGNLQTTTALGVDGMQQGAKVDLPISVEILIPNSDQSRSRQRRLCHCWISLDVRPTGNSGE